MMRKVVYSILVLVATLATLTGCKKQDWLDWKLQNELWMAQNLKQEYIVNDSAYIVQQSQSGLQYCIIADPNPTDARPMTNNTVYCDYEGKLINGAVFDRGNYAALGVSSVVSGFAEGIKKIHTNGDIVLFIPYDLGYKETGAGAEGGSSFIPPYSTLIFTIHLCAVD